MTILAASNSFAIFCSFSSLHAIFGPHDKLQTIDARINSILTNRKKSSYLSLVRYFISEGNRREYNATTATDNE